MKSAILDKFEKDYPCIIELPVQWGEMDAFNHVNNVLYFRYFESSRLALFEKTSMMSDMPKTDIGPILAETSCRYRRPLNYPDRIHVGTRVSEISEFGFTQDYAIYSKELDDISTLATSRVTMLNYKTGERIKIEGPLLKSLVELQKP